MAPSLQELIDFLLNEVALCGSQGEYSSKPALRPTLLGTMYTAVPHMRLWNMHVSHRCILELVLSCFYSLDLSCLISSTVAFW
jgi:hypothetical protein